MGGCGRAMVLGNFQTQGVLLVWIKEEQGPNVLAVGTGGDCWIFLSLVYHFSFLSFVSVGGGTSWTEISSEKPLIQKNQPNKYSGKGVASCSLVSQWRPSGLQKLFKASSGLGK